MNFYRLLLTVHVLSAVWLGASAFGGAVVRAAGKRAPDLAGKVGALRIGWRLASVFGLPGSIVAGLTGIWMLLVNTPLFDLPKVGWIHASLTLWVVIVSINLFYTFPRLRKTLAAAEASLEAGAPTDELKRLTASKLPARLADLTAMAIVIFVVLMVLRPF